MNISKYIAFAAVAAVALTSSAAQNLCVTYYGWDKYPDGTTVGEEWYALCWSKNTTFAGLKFDCTPVNANDKVVKIQKDIPETKNSKGSYLHYFEFENLDWDTSLGGKFFVVRLDTRGKDGKTAETSPENLLQAVIVSASCKPSPTASSEAVTGAAWGDSVIDEGTAGYKLPTITGFTVLDDKNVEIQVADMMPNVKYNVKMGSTPTELNDYGLTVPQWPDAKCEATITVPAKDAKFFRVTRDTVNK